MAKVRCYFLSLTGAVYGFLGADGRSCNSATASFNFCFSSSAAHSRHVAPFTERFVESIVTSKCVRISEPAKFRLSTHSLTMRSIPVRKLRLLEGAKTRRVRRAQFLRNRRFRSLELFSFVCAAGQGNGHREENEQQGWLHMSGLHRFGIMIGTIAWGDEQQTLSTSKCADLARSVQEE